MFRYCFLAIFFHIFHHLATSVFNKSVFSVHHYLVKLKTVHCPQVCWNHSN